MIGTLSTVSWRRILLSVDADCLGIWNGCPWIVTTHTDTCANTRKVNYLIEFSRNTQSWECWHFLLLLLWKYACYQLPQLPYHDKCRFVVKFDFFGKHFLFILIRSCAKNANIANFVYYGKTRMYDCGLSWTPTVNSIIKLTRKLKEDLLASYTL